MPANLPPDYFEEEKKLRQAKTPEEKIVVIERMLAIMPHHKGTDKLIASHRSRIAKLKEEMERRPQSQKKSDPRFNIKKEGAGQVVFIGFPNTGKSSLVGALSGEPLEVADYPFTTRILHQRMMRYEDILIQLIDTPALGDENTSLWFSNMVRKAETVVCVLGLSDALETEFELLLEEIRTHVPDMVRDRSTFIVAVNKLDLTRYSQQLEAFQRACGGYTILPVSAKNDVNLHQLREMLFHTLGVIRVYSKLPGKKPDLDAPFVLKRGTTLLDCAVRVHKDFLERLKYAKLWRAGAYNGMMVSKDFILEDRDIIELHQ